MILPNQNLFNPSQVKRHGKVSFHIYIYIYKVFLFQHYIHKKILNTFFNNLHPILFLLNFNSNQYIEWKFSIDFFPFKQQEAPTNQRFKVLYTMSQDTKKQIGVENILYFIYSSNQGLLESAIGRTLGDVGKVPKFCF